MELFLFGLLLLAVAVAAAWWFASGRGAAGSSEQPPPRAWASETVTPVMMGPRNKAPERVARRFVIDQGALLALKMAQVDGEIVDVEREAVRRFILAEGRDLDEHGAELALARAEGSLDNPIQVENAIEGLRALSSEEQRQALVDLLVQVAQADGHIRDAEVVFMERVGAKLGLSSADVKKRIALP
ncbi:MAG: TerB family tellurite resistance protein [Alphaproteobacteria bacterium]|nr:TerB family tellurite resistance protein [Alphaproteobacteria bacterium]MCB9691094.1 TerB family tellurite resistance protein [Alphaproteobacteria bacterium]